MGLANNLIYYVVYTICLVLNIHYIIAGTVAFFVSVINAFYFNDKYVFVSKEETNRKWWKTFIKTFLSYAGTGLILNNILLIVWVDIVGLKEIVAPLLNLFITVPLNYIINKFWTFREKV